MKREYKILKRLRKNSIAFGLAFVMACSSFSVYANDGQEYTEDQIVLTDGQSETQEGSTEDVGIPTEQNGNGVAADSDGQGDVAEQGDDAQYGTSETGEAADSEPTTEEFVVWFDGTLGLSSNNNGRQNLEDVIWYEGATNTKVDTVKHKVTLPDNAGQLKNYNYKLQGWYDITHKKYYSSEYFGKEIEVDSNTVFYADWFAESYDFGTDTGTVKDQPDTSSFINTNVFDFNELFNLLSSNVNQIKADATGHQEKWSLEKDVNADVTVDANKDGVAEVAKSLGFIFLNWSYYDITNSTDGDARESIGYMDNLGNDTIAKENQLDNDHLTQGIISGDGDRGQRILDSLFSQQDGLGKKYVGSGDYLYQYDNDSTSENYGYYYYDSSKNGASYNQSAKRFYVYQDPETIDGQSLHKGSWINWEDNGKTSTAFLPFNDGKSNDNKDDKTYNEKDGSINYWFGMSSSVQFWLPNNVGKGNLSSQGSQMEFKFSGDDDVWVFVDNQLVLDLGGIHGKKSGSINFSTGVVTADGKTSNYYTTAGDHTLTIYYLERGTSESNCSIYFNIAPRYSLSVDKVDEETDENGQEVKLSGTTFEIFENAECTKKAELWDSAADCNAKRESKNTFTTDENGTLNCYGLVAGYTYYLKETSATTGYDAKANVVKLTVANDGSIEVEDADNLTEDANADQGSKHFSMKVKNRRRKINVSVNKVWDDSENNDNIRPESVTVELLKNGNATGQTVTLSAENNWSASFDNLRQYDGNTEIEYSVKEANVPDGYEVSVGGSMTDGFTVTNTHTPETISISGTKTWDDNDNQDGQRPESITIRLYADNTEVDSKTVSATDNWSYTFENLNKYKDGKEITYTVSEDAVTNYTSSQDGYNFTNTHTPGKTSVNVKKVWNDSDNKDGIRPESVTVKLLANGEVTDKTVTLSAENDWSSSFTDLDEYKDGQNITYTIEEVKVDGYTVEITGDATKGYTITNTHTPEEPQTPENPDTPKNDKKKVKTGTQLNIVLWTSLISIALLGIIVAIVFRKKHQM